MRYAIGGLSHPIAHASTVREALEAAERFRGPSYGEHVHVIEAEHVAPDLSGVIQRPWAGGTWGGRCGSTRWIPDPDGLHRTMRQVMCALAGERLSAWQTSTARDSIATMQSWWVRGFDKAAEQHGFRVECQQKFRHDGPCQTEQWRWDGHTLTPLPDA